MIQTNPVMQDEAKKWEPVDKMASMLMQRAKYLNLPPDQFRYLITGREKGEASESEEVERYAHKHELEKKYRNLEKKRVKSLEAKCNALEREIERLSSIVEMQESIIKDYEA